MMNESQINENCFYVYYHKPSKRKFNMIVEPYESHQKIKITLIDIDIGLESKPILKQTQIQDKNFYIIWMEDEISAFNIEKLKMTITKISNGQEVFHFKYLTDWALTNDLGDVENFKNYDQYFEMKGLASEFNEQFRSQDIIIE